MKQFVETVGIGKILLYFIIINVIGFLAMAIDKWKAKNNAWRIPENTLFSITVLGGGIAKVYYRNACNTCFRNSFSNI